MKNVLKRWYLIPARSVICGSYTRQDLGEMEMEIIDLAESSEVDARRNVERVNKTLYETHMISPATVRCL